MRWLIGPAFTLAFVSAHAQEFDCTESMSHEAWSAEMDRIDAYFAAFDLEKAGKAARGIRDRVRCLDRIVLPSHLGRYARQMALVAFYEQDEITTIRWGRLQQYAAPGMPWPEDFTEDHPVREMLDFATEPAIAGPSGVGLLYPKNGAVFMNGTLLEQPEARAEVPNLIQVTDKKGTLVLQYWQDGAAFREDVLGPPGMVPKLPKWFVAEQTGYEQQSSSLFGGDVGTSDDAVSAADDGTSTESSPSDAASPDPDDGSPAVAQADPAPRPMTPPPSTRSGGSGRLLLGAGTAVLGGALYGLAATQRGGLGDATSTTELAQARTVVNALVITGGVVGASGLGLTVSGLVDGGTVGFHTRF